MALTGVDKVKLNKYLREHSIDALNYYAMCDYLGKRGKITDGEFIDYFTDCVINEFSKDVKISIKHVAKLVSFVGNFAGWMHEEGSVISDETLDKIRSFDQLYDDYLVRNVIDCDTEFREHCILEVIDKINGLYPCEENIESLAKYIVKVRELEESIRGLERTLEDAKREYGILQGECEKANLKVDFVSGELNSVREELREKKEYIRELEDSLWDMKAKIIGLEGDLSNVTSERDELLPYKKQFEELSSEVTRLGKIISDFREQEEKKRLQAEKDGQLSSLIYQKLLVESASIDDLLKVISKHGIVSDSSEVARILREMKRNINITSGSFSKAPTYKIVKPKLMANGKFVIDVPYGCKHYDVMLVSDFHIREFDNKTLSGMDALYNYCSKQGINLILNLGDLYDGFGNRPVVYEDALNNFRIVDESIDKFPKDTGIYHAIMGGNHERNMSHCGFDPIRTLTDAREDFIDLGYYHSTVCLDNPATRLGKFDLHHPSDFDFPIDLNDEGLTIGYMNEYLQDTYDKVGRSREDSYIDILGHTHRCQFNYPESYCYIPSYFDGKNKRGACHLRIYIDEDTGFKYMVFMPLSYNSNKLVKNNEIVYQKVLSR